jgi:hypothetical protein
LLEPDLWRRISDLPNRSALLRGSDRGSGIGYGICSCILSGVCLGILDGLRLNILYRLRLSILYRLCRGILDGLCRRDLRPCIFAGRPSLELT